MKERVSIARCPRRGQYPFEDNAVLLGFGMIEEVQRTFGYPSKYLSERSLATPSNVYDMELRV